MQHNSIVDIHVVLYRGPPTLFTCIYLLMKLLSTHVIIKYQSIIINITLQMYIYICSRLFYSVKTICIIIIMYYSVHIYIHVHVHVVGFRDTNYYIRYVCNTYMYAILHVFLDYIF